jgi:citrate lyase subunit beta / citryl-CoA lyase
MSTDIILRRSQLVVPASSDKMILKSATLDTDAIVFDLEDGIAPSAKTEARANIRGLLDGIDFKGKEVGVRINGPASPWWLDDLLAVEGARIDTVILPKVNRPEDVVAVALILNQFILRGSARKVTLQILIESAQGLEAIGEIVHASTLVTTVIFGAGDYAADSGVALTSRGLNYARARIAAAAAAAGIEAIDYVHADFRDDNGLSEQVQEARELGYNGKWAIHPQQIPVINRGFSPTLKEVAEAERMVALYDTAMERGIGAVSAGGFMLDEAVLRIMRRRIDLAHRIGMRSGENSVKLSGPDCPGR